MLKGKFITIEGCEGAGKTTQIKNLKEYFNGENFPIFFTREPGGPPISESIRSIVLSGRFQQMDPITELLLYTASRRQLTMEVIKEKLDNGITVVCDRYIDSTTAYQGFGRGLDLDMISSLNKWAMGDLKIDRTIFLDVSPERSFLRKNLSAGLDRIERESEEFHKRVYDGYRWLSEKYPERIIKIDASRTKRLIFEEIINIFRQKNIFLL